MFSTVFLCGVVTLLCLTAVSLVRYKYKLFQANRSRRISLDSFFWAIGFLPVAIVTISNISFGNPALSSIVTFLRNPVLTIDLTIGAFAQFGQLSFLMNIITAILLGSVVVISLSKDSFLLKNPASESARKDFGKSRAGAEEEDSTELARPYLRYCRILS